MQKKTNDFYFNFDAAQKSGGSALQNDVLMKELAGLIAQSPKTVTDTIRNSGIPISANASTKVIVNKIFEQGANTNLHESLSKLLLLNDTYGHSVSIGADGTTYVGNAPTGMFDHYDDEQRAVDKNGNYIDLPPAKIGFWKKVAGAFKSIFKGYVGGNNTTDSIIDAVRPLSETFMTKMNSDALLTEIRPVLTQYTYGANIDTTLANLRPIAQKYMSKEQADTLLTRVKPFIQRLAVSTKPTSETAAPANTGAVLAPKPTKEAVAAKAKLTAALKEKGVDVGMGTGTIIGISVFVVGAIALGVYAYKHYKK